VIIFTQVLHNFLVPEDEIDQLVERARADNYQLFQSDAIPIRTFRHTDIADFNITCLRMTGDSNRFLGKPLHELNLRAQYGINILAIKRGEETRQSIQPEEELRPGDILYLQGSPAHIEKFHQMVK
jgi:CPA2 family monovalent cation:H+ antiporter-2